MSDAYMTGMNREHDRGLNPPILSIFQLPMRLVRKIVDEAIDDKVLLARHHAAETGKRFLHDEADDRRVRSYSLASPHVSYLVLHPRLGIYQKGEATIDADDVSHRGERILNLVVDRFSGGLKEATGYIRDELLEGCPLGR